jgi:cardiolipin synthase
MSAHLQAAPKTSTTSSNAPTDFMIVSSTTRNEFVLALLTDLQRGHYTPRAWWRFLSDSWHKSWATARAHPALTRSWLRVSLLMVALAAAGFSGIWLIEGQHTALRLLPSLLACLTLQQGDGFVHLGLNRRPWDGLLRERLGIPTSLTLARGVMANLLLAHLLSGQVPLPGFIISVYLIGIATDMADGQIARRTGWQTRLGGYLDSEADLFLSLSATLSTLLAGLLPTWIALLILLRFALPIAGALLSYVVAIRQVDFSHTFWGRSAGTAQAALLLIVLAPEPLAHLLAPVYLPMLLITPTLLMLAPLTEIRKHLRCWCK